MSINFAKGVIERNVLLIERHLIVNRYVAVDAAVSDNFVFIGFMSVIGCFSLFALQYVIQLMLSKAA